MSGFQTINTNKISFNSNDSLVHSDGKFGYALNYGMKIVHTKMFILFKTLIITLNNTTKNTTTNTTNNSTNDKTNDNTNNNTNNITNDNTNNNTKNSTNNNTNDKTNDNTNNKTNNSTNDKTNNNTNSIGIWVIAGIVCIIILLAALALGSYLIKKFWFKRKMIK